MKRPALSILLAPLLAALPSPAHSADPPTSPEPPRVHSGFQQEVSERTIRGRVAVVDGRTVWFPHRAVLVRLAGIDSCELPQWSYDPTRHGDHPIPKAVPCGPFAKAWLKRSIGASDVVCRTTSSQADPDALTGACTAGGRDLALEMIRAGWARVRDFSPPRPEYIAWQQHAMNARYGMWATYVLDMDEWRRKSVDKTLSRRPIADFNLLAERESEISPPFGDARRRPARTDR
nr:thermonuclease family protein [Nitrosomonas nitrosa]